MAVVRWKDLFLSRAAAIAFFIVVGISDSTTLAAQEAQEDATFRAGVNLVLADVSVTDARGTPVSGLTRDQFEVKEGRKTRPIVRFEEGSARISLALVVDYSGSMRSRQDAVLRGIDALVAQLLPEDEIALISFNEHVNVLNNFVSTVKAEDWIDPLRNQKPMGQTALYDAILRASQLLETSAQERRVIVVLSDGQDTASKTSREEVIDELRSSNRLLYAVGLFAPGDPDSNSSTLRKLAETTGGSAIFDSDGLQLPQTFTTIMKDLRSRYLLGFYAEAPTGRAVEVRRISISVHTLGKGSMNVRARREYRIGVPSSDQPSRGQ